ncbi:MAG: heavy-metal-associated domain-containing protein [Propionibacteriaceae bacterium]
MMIQKYIISGMTCGNCVKHVTEEVADLPGVTKVEILLDGGHMTLTVSEPLTFDVVKAAVIEAGNYEVVAV